jgi:hypothetical protein
MAAQAEILALLRQKEIRAPITPEGILYLPPITLIATGMKAAIRFLFQSPPAQGALLDMNSPGILRILNGRFTDPIPIVVQ